MLIKINRKGSTPGKRFWGCSGFPRCRGVRDTAEIQEEPPRADRMDARQSADTREVPPSYATSGLSAAPQSQHAAFNHSTPGAHERVPDRATSSNPVRWSPPPGDVGNWQLTFRNASARLGCFDALTLRDTRPTFVLPRPHEDSMALWLHPGNSEASPLSSDWSVALETVRKIMQRGTRPPCPPGVESQIASGLGIPFYDACGRKGPDELEDLLHAQVTDDDVETATSWSDKSARLSEAFYDSPQEVAVRSIVTDVLGSDAHRWCHPQAVIEQLMTGAGLPTEGARRVDLLIAVPGTKLLAIEVDGPEHDSNTDKARDIALERAGVDVVRVTNREVDARTGPSIDDLSYALSTRTRARSLPSQTAIQCVIGPVEAARIGLAVLVAFEKGLLRPTCEWVIEVNCESGIGVSAVVAACELVNGAAALWSNPVPCPRLIVHDLRTDQVASFEAPSSVRLNLLDVPPTTANAAHVRIRSEPFTGPYAALPTTGANTPTLLVRPSGLPVPLEDSQAITPTRVAMHDDPSTAQRRHRALELLLNDVFRKRDFREGQELAISSILRGNDTVVLLPTGAGKSLIYQFAGLVLPGTCLVIDPLVALIEDQVDGLQQFGIDRAKGFSFDPSAQQRDSDNGWLKNGRSSFLLVAPERLQIPSFRRDLATLQLIRPINLAVVDEAHCVSEWGHDFRPSYLRLGDVLRQACADVYGTPPPILAMTGTASRAVLRDMLADLKIDRTRPGAVVTPLSFDRAELCFRVRRVAPSDRPGAIVGEIQTIPGWFREDTNRFFSTRGPKSAAGIIFCVHVNGPRGIVDVAQDVAVVTGTQPGIFAGGAPKGFDRSTWVTMKRETQRRFKTNQLNLLVATKAFGMGIDKPNVRYTIHNGLPPSMEAFYQEAGRAGRDRKRALCTLVFATTNDTRVRRLLEPGTSLENVRAEFLAVAKRDRDDVIDLLYFHLKSFPGISSEVAIGKLLVQLISPSSEPKTIDVAFDDETLVPSEDDDTVTSDEQRGRIERGLNRLLVVGALSDYRVDFGAKLFSVDVARHDPNRLIDAVHRNRMRIDPQRATMRKDELMSLRAEPAGDAVVLAVTALIAETYETIELARRRALYEMWNTANAAAGVANAEEQDRTLRHRLLDYLREGDMDAEIERLRTATSFEFDPWIQFIEKTRDPIEAGELRGRAIRHLESYPDHPGLLLLRGASELFSPPSLRARSTERDDLRSNLLAAFRFATKRYGVTGGQVSDAIMRFRQLCRMRFPDWTPWMFELATEASDDGSRFASAELLDTWSDEMLRGEGNYNAATALTYRMHELTAMVKDAAGPYMAPQRNHER